ncbi:MAG: RNA-directed DNA polymerase [Deltaproteobacteria bacterium]|nr:RNA-directed DNA polymerase [Deltaproteobacteria bacterium]
MADSHDSTEVSLPEWKGIAEAGGIESWIHRELERRQLIEEVDYASLSKAEKKAYKARRDEERRVRRLLRKHAWQAYKKAHVVHLGRGVFYHDTPDYDRYDIDGREERLADNALPEIADASALAEALGITVPTMRWLAYHREVDSGTHYRRWTVPKRDGRRRLISEPKPQLKEAQRWIAREITDHLPVHGAAHGFLAGRSTVTNAAVHAGARIVVKLDLKDYYPTITTPRVKGMFRKAGYGEQVATLLAMLCTESPREEIELDGKTWYVATGPRSLPQGAPTSPSITNAISLRLDLRLAGLARKMGFRYTRYADDLTFSHHQRSEAPIGSLFRLVGQIVVEEGFEVHPKKTRVMRSGSRQKVTGLVVNGADGAPAARVPRSVRRKLRAAIKNRELGRPGEGESLAQLRGWAAYVYMTDPAKGRALLDRLAALGGESDEGGTDG